MIINTSAPTLTSCDDSKEVFYENLNSLFKSTAASDKLLVLGNFNARIGLDCENWK